MPDDNIIRQLLKALTPLDCQEIRDSDRLDRFLLDQLGREQDEWVREHLLVCDECFDAFSEVVGHKVDSGELPLREWPRDLALPAREENASYQAASQGEGVGIYWERVREAVVSGKEWAQEKLAEARRWFEGAVALWRLMTESGHSFSGADLGPHASVMFDRDRLHVGEAPAASAIQISVEVVDPAWRPRGRTVPFEVREKDGPVVTADGRLTLTLHTLEAEWQGAPVVCTVLLVEGRRASFESVVEPEPSAQGGRVRFTAEGLPQGPVDVPVPLECLRLYLILSPTDR